MEKQATAETLERLNTELQALQALQREHVEEGHRLDVLVPALEAEMKKKGAFMTVIVTLAELTYSLITFTDVNTTILTCRLCNDNSHNNCALATIHV